MDAQDAQAAYIHILEAELAHMSAAYYALTTANVNLKYPLEYAPSTPKRFPCANCQSYETIKRVDCCVCNGKRSVCYSCTKWSTCRCDACNRVHWACPDHDLTSVGGYYDCLPCETRVWYCNRCIAEEETFCLDCRRDKTQ
jgi:hypothetical protein